MTSGTHQSQLPPPPPPPVDSHDYIPPPPPLPEDPQCVHSAPGSETGQSLSVSVNVNVSGMTSSSILSRLKRASKIETAKGTDSHAGSGTPKHRPVSPMHQLAILHSPSSSRLTVTHLTNNGSDDASGSGLPPSPHSHSRSQCRAKGCALLTDTTNSDGLCPTHLFEGKLEDAKHPSHMHSHSLSRSGSLQQLTSNVNGSKAPLSPRIPPTVTTPSVAATRLSAANAHIPAILAPVSASSSSPTSAKASHAELLVRELLSTEQSYLNSLAIAINVFQHRLHAYHALGRPLIIDDDTNKIFTNVREIYELNSKMFLELNAAWQEHGTLLTCETARIIIQYSELFHSYYCSYVCRHDDSNALLQSQKKSNKEFELFVRVNELCERTRIEDLLIQPIQRIPRYLLLFKGINAELKQQSDAALVNGFVEAQQCLSQLATSINQSLHSKHSYTYMVALSSRILDCPFPLLSSHRYHVHDSVLRKKFSNSSLKFQQWKKYWFLLFNDILLYTTVSTSSSGSSGSGGGSGGSGASEDKVKMKHFLWLKDCHVTRIVSGMTNDRTVFEIRNSFKCLTLGCETEEERERWIIILDSTIQSARAKRLSSSGNSSNSHASSNGELRIDSRSYSGRDDSDNELDSSAVVFTPSPLTPGRRQTAPPVLLHSP